MYEANRFVTSARSQVVVSGDTVIIGGDIVKAFKGVRIVNLDNLLTYLEENTLPSQTVDLTVLRNNEPLQCL